MGGGASRPKNKAKGGPPPALGLDGLGLLTPSQRRRRRLLFGTEGKRRFEDVPPPQQFFANQEEEDDPVFWRLNDLNATNLFRTKANGLQDVNGFLPERAIELLEMNLGTGTNKLSGRLFHVGQAQYLITNVRAATAPGGFPSAPPSGGRPEMLTCYELLALYSLIRAGTNDELLELLFCIFDVDGDDRVSSSDLVEMIEPFLELSGAKDGLSGADVEDYNRLVLGKARTAAVRKIAEKAIETYGTCTLEDDLPPEASAANTTAGIAAPPPAGGVTEGPTVMHTGSHGTDGSLESKPAKAGGAGPNSDNDDDDDHDVQSLGQASTEAAIDTPVDQSQQTKPKRGFGSLCGSKKQASDPSDAAARKDSPKPKAGAKKPERKNSRLFGKKAKKGPQVLGLAQFREWLLESQLLPAELKASLAAEQSPPPRGAGVGLMGSGPAAPPLPRDVVSQPAPSQGYPAPAQSQAPVQQVVSVRRTVEGVSADDSGSEASDGARPA